MLFDPADATRTVSRGVAFDYFLKSAADSVTIEVLDSQGSAIRTFTGTASPAPDKPAAPAAEGERRRPARDGRPAGRRRAGHEPVHVGHAPCGRA